MRLPPPPANCWLAPCRERYLDLHPRPPGAEAASERELRRLARSAKSASIEWPYLGLLAGIDYHLPSLFPMANVTRERRWKVQVGDEETTAVFQPASPPPAGGLFVCAPGAGGHLADRGLGQAAEALGGIGLGIVRFNFLYRG